MYLVPEFILDGRKNRTQIIMILMIYAVKTLSNHNHHKNLCSNEIAIQDLPISTKFF